MELILVVVISAGMAENSQNGVSRSLSQPAAVAVRPSAAAHCLQCMRSWYPVVSVDMTCLHGSR